MNSHNIIPASPSRGWKNESIVQKSYGKQCSASFKESMSTYRSTKVLYTLHSVLWIQRQVDIISKTASTEIEELDRLALDNRNIYKHSSLHQILSPENKYSCKHYQYSTNQSTHYKDHQPTHTGKRLFQCSAIGCGKLFFRRTILNRHTKTHTSKKLFHCHEIGCGKSFAKNQHLKEHTRIHTGERPLHCSEPGCGQSFNRHSGLRKHKILIHSWETPSKWA